MRMLVILALLVACDEGTKSKAKEAVDKVDKTIDKLDTSDAKAYLAKAKAAIAAATEPVAECSWLERQPAESPAKVTLDELRKLCTFDAPLARATAAVVRAEKAKAEQPEAPSLTECQSDDWAAMKARLDGSPQASDPAWAAVKARWAKVCPDSK